MGSGDERELVRRGYDALSYHYRSDDAGEGRYAPWLAALRERLPAGGSVLDLGCGCGVPVARSLAAAGYQVTGVDISEVQIERAQRLVPAGTFIRADASEVASPRVVRCRGQPLRPHPPATGRSSRDCCGGRRAGCAPEGGCSR